MRDEQLSTSDFVATGDRAGVKDIPVQEANGREPEATGTYGGGGARMVRDNTSTVTPLFQDTECNDFRTKWDQIQIGFVDEPKKAVQDADSLVAQTMKRLAEIFSDERKKMEDQWSRGDDVSTEDLRVALQRYRSFFNRLLSM
jgi:hypothetical protein